MTESFKQISDRLLNSSSYEHIDEVEWDIEKLVKIHHELEQENKVLVEALELYSDSCNFYGEVRECDLDTDPGGNIVQFFGTKARQALAKLKKEGEG